MQIVGPQLAQINLEVVDDPRQEPLKRVDVLGFIEFEADLDLQIRPLARVRRQVHHHLGQVEEDHVDLSLPGLLADAVALEQGHGEKDARANDDKQSQCPGGTEYQGLATKLRRRRLRFVVQEGHLLFDVFVCSDFAHGLLA